MPREKLEIWVEYPMTGGLLLSTIHGGEYYKMRYFYYALRDAKRLFREYVRREEKNR